MDFQKTKDLLDQLSQRFNRPDFIAPDPISIPHRFTKKEDIEIAGFVAATIAWGNRCSILRSASRMMELMGNEPHRFVINASDKEKKPLLKFVHRTFNGGDLLFFTESLKNIYKNHNGIHKVFSNGFRETGNITGAMTHFRKIFLETEHEKRSEKHISDIAKGAAAKRLNMYLRWMVRKDKQGVDFGLWPDIPMSELLIPLDIHTATVARKLELLSRKQNDFRAVTELTETLRNFDPKDPVKYDYALFGAGVTKTII